MKTSTVTRLPVSAPAARPKGQQTKAAIVDAALQMAAQVGLEGLSIGLLADHLHMSKSGVFAHFGSREELQLSVVREYHARFERDVFMPAMQAKRGLPRVRALFDHWMKRTSEEIDSGCIYIGGAVEFDDQPGPVRDELVRSVRAWIDAVITAIDMAIAEGHLQADTDARQVGFEIHGLILALHYEARLLRDPKATQRAHTAFEGILARHSAKGLTVTRRKTKT
jgi:AcrR family transcriptional regulator